MTNLDAMKKLTDLFYQDAALKHHEAVMELEAALLVDDIELATYKSRFFAEIEQWVMSYGIECTFQGEALFFYRKGREFEYSLVDGIKLIITEIEAHNSCQGQ